MLQRISLRPLRIHRADSGDRRRTGCVVSLYIACRAVQLGIPRITTARMVLNVGIESLLGAAPFLGAIFDTVFKANRRNYHLLRSHISRSRGQTARDWLFVVVAGLLGAANVTLPVILLIELARWI